MNNRPSHLLRIILLILCTGALALGSFWLLELMRRSADEAAPARQRSEPDFYVENFNFIRIDKTGVARTNVFGTRLTHNPQSDTYDVQKPLVNSYSDRPTMVSRAVRATIENQTDKLHLYEQVNIERPASPSTQHFRLRTEYLLVLPDQDVMQTPLAVEIINGSTRVTGTGMFANNATGEFKLHKNTRVFYQPPGG